MSNHSIPRSLDDIDYYDALLAGIIIALGAGASLSIHESVALYHGLAAGSVVATIILFEIIFRNPPVGRSATKQGLSAIVMAAWVITILLAV